MKPKWVIVRPGDTISRMAATHRMTREHLAALNPEAASQPYLLAGQMLRIVPGTGCRYVVQPGETAGGIAKRFGIMEEEIRRANADIAKMGDWCGRCIHIPDAIGKTIIKIQGEYGYRNMNHDIQELEKRYPFIRTGSIGMSVMGKPLPYVRIGEGTRHIHVNASVHANEWLTTPVLLRFVEQYAAAVGTASSWHGFQPDQWFKETTLWVVPMVNPDGVELVQEGTVNGHPYADELLTWNSGRADFTNWKANIRGVDLNDQFPAYWEEEVARRGMASPGPRDYAGSAPLSEPEALALAQWTEQRDFSSIVSLHSQGQEIYWNYRDLEPVESVWLSRRLAKASGYKAVKLSGSDAGYKDWFIQKFGRPGFTVEMGLGVNPLPVEQFDNLCLEIGMLLGELLSGDGKKGTP